MEVCGFRNYRPGIIFIILLVIILGQVWGQRSEIRARKKPINVVLLLPMNNKYMFSYARVRPALEIALEKLGSSTGLLPGHYLNVYYNDTNCNEALGMNYAINYFFNKQVDMFLGPVCDYVVAPILRQATFWNLPMITAGANAWGFVKHRRTMFPMLTRVGPVNHYSLFNFFISQLRLYSWKKVKVLYDKGGQDSIVTDFCHLSIEVLVNELRSSQTIVQQVGLSKFDDTFNFKKFILGEVALDNSDVGH